MKLTKTDLAALASDCLYELNKCKERDGNDAYQIVLQALEASRTPHKWPTRDDFYKFAKISLTKQQCEAIYDWFESFVEKENLK